MVKEKRSVGKVSSILTLNKTEYKILLLLNGVTRARPYTMGEILGFEDRQNSLRKCRENNYATSVGEGKKTFYSITPFGKRALKFYNEYIDLMPNGEKKKELLEIREKLEKYKL